MPTLLDLFRLNNESLSYNDAVNPNGIPTRLRNIPPAPVKPEWDIRSGLPEPGLGHVAPEEWLPTGVGTKLASLIGKGALMMGAVKSAAKSRLSHNPEERALAFLTAQRNAAKPVSEGGLGLRPDNTAEERASAMGFNGEGYHYSKAENEVTHLDPLNNPTGIRKAIREIGNTPSDFIGTHVGSKGAARERYEGYARVGEPVGATYPVKFKNDLPFNHLDYVDIRSDLPYGLLKGDPNKIIHDSDFSGIPYDVYGIGMENVPSKAKILGMRRDLFHKNSNIPYFNEYEDADSISHVLPPENIRSRFAAFDPAKRGDPDLLGYADPKLLGLIAGGTAGGIALNQLLRLNDTKQ